MNITPEDLMKRLEGFLWSAADKEKVLQILGDALQEAREQGWEAGLDAGYMSRRD